MILLQIGETLGGFSEDRPPEPSYIKDKIALSRVLKGVIINQSIRRYERKRYHRSIPSVMASSKNSVRHHCGLSGASENSELGVSHSPTGYKDRVPGIEPITILRHGNCVQNACVLRCSLTQHPNSQCNLIIMLHCENALFV